MPPPPDAPAITLVRPVCGVDNFAEETLRSSFGLDYPRYQLIFCVASARDPIVPVINRLIAENLGHDARLLIGDDRRTGNPKLDNCIKGWNAATHEWIVLADSNVLMPRDYLQRLRARMTPDTGLVCSPPVGSHPDGVWARLECAFLNTYQVRWQYFADALGSGFAQGKTMLWRREVLDRHGGILALGSDIAEDAASTKLVREADLQVHLFDAPFEQPLGQRGFKEVWNRQVRWARLRRACFPGYFLPEIFGGALMPLIAVAIVAASFDVPPLGAVLALATLWYGSEMMLAWAAPWPRSALDPLYAILRDLLLPALWINGWIGSHFVWRGHAMTTQNFAAEIGGEEMCDLATRKVR